MSIQVARVFQGRWTAFWATTFGFDPILFEEYLLRRLGERPLNATVLADFDQLAGAFAEAGEEDRVARRANRDYLLRGVRLGGAFHPKTYFFADDRSGVLLVGSGNLTLPGIEDGQEIFVHFDPSSPEGLDAILSWRDWMEQIVGRVADREVSFRWADLRRRVPWLVGVPRAGRFVSNVEAALVDQLCAGLDAPVDELHVLAPYYDREARALQALVQRLRPRALRLYLGARTSVEGGALTRVLQDSKARVTVAAFEPATMVHAKLVGVIKNKRGRLLSGSANLSQAALLSTLRHDQWANAEAGVLFDGDPDRVRAAFQSHGLELREIPLASVSQLRFTPGADLPGVPLVLRVARLLDDFRVEVEFEGATEVPAFVTAGMASQRLLGTRSAAALACPEEGALIWLCADDGSVLSNRVPLDEPSRLRSWLEEREDAADRPRELDPASASTPVGRMLQYLHETCIFDIDETPAAQRARNASSEQESADEQNWDFIDQLTKDELRYDSRLERYRAGAGHDLPLDDDVLVLLRTMLERTPAPWRLHIVGDEEAGTEGSDSGKSWTPERRLQVRLFNLLERWCGALNDPRFAWIDPAAPARNYAALLVALAECWENGYLQEHKITHLLKTLFSSFLAGERAPGFLMRLAPDERAGVLGRIPDEARALAAALVYSGVSANCSWARVIFEWQPFLEVGLELKVISVGKGSPELVARLTAEKVAPLAMEQRLQWARTFTDDDHWCEKQQRDLGFKVVEIVREKVNERFGIVLSVNDADLSNPALVTLVHRALVYRATKGAIVRFGTGRLSIYLSDALYVREGERSLESTVPVTEESLAALERSGGAFIQIVPQPDVAAAS